MATLLSDNFNRADSSTTLGSPQTGPAPTVTASAGAIGIISNTTYGSATTGDKRALYSLGTANVRLKMTVTTGGTDAGLVLRATDANNFYYLSTQASGRLRFYRNVANSYSILIDWSTGYYSNGDIIEVRAYADVIGIYKNNENVGAVVSSTYQTNTSHGFRFNDTNTRFDDLFAEDYAIPTVGNAVDLSALPNSSISTASHVYKGRDTAAADTGSAS